MGIAAVDAGADGSGTGNSDGGAVAGGNACTAAVCDSFLWLASLASSLLILPILSSWQLRVTDGELLMREELLVKLREG